MKKVRIKNNLGEEIEVNEEFAKAFKESQEYGDTVKDGDENIEIDE